MSELNDETTMTDREIRMRLTKLMGIGQHYAQPWERLFDEVRLRQVSHERLHKLASFLGLEVPR